MNRRNCRTDHSLLANPYKVWKESPPGPEQRELERMFAANLIEDRVKPDTIRLSNPIFMNFSSRVFAAHYRKTKAKFGLCAKVNNSDNDRIETTIPELGGFINKTKHSEELEGELSSNDGYVPPIRFENPPFVTWSYTDHVKKCDFVCVAIPTISGAHKITFALSDDGTALNISYVWPKALYNPKDLFQDQVNKENITMDHPKIHAFVSHLLDNGITDKSLPTSIITVDLPKKVQRETGSWKKAAIKSNDTKIIFLEFKAFQKQQFIDDDDTSISFD